MSQPTHARRTRVAILGGGMASLSAAAELMREPGASERYEITVYQMGWRVGGKGASGRNRDPGMGMRIEEHGLHVWFGCYHNAWQLLGRCYQALGREQDLARLFQGQTDTPYMEDAGGWKVWPVSFPRKYGTLGDDSLRQQLAGWLRMIGHWLAGLAGRMVAHGHAGKPHHGLLRRLVDDAEAAMASFGQHLQALEHYAQDVRQATATPAGAQDPHRALALAAEGLHALLLGEPVPLDRLEDDLRRDAIMLDLGIATVRGLLADDVLLRGFDALDGEDIRAWYRRHGARDETLQSAPIRALYDLCFAYRGGAVSWANADFAAGAALVTVLRIALEYPDYVVYEMRAGMGEVVIAPIYQALKQQGVRFAFFHQATRLELAADARSVAAVHMVQQATVKDGAEYQPLFELPLPDSGIPGITALSCWPSTPLLDQLEQGEALRGVNLESAWNGWPGAGPLTLRSGEDYDLLVLGTSLAEVQRLCPGFAEKLPRWRAMFDTMVTVPTAAAQLWMNRSLEELGWTHGAVPIDAGPEPMDVWADRSDILPRERWPADGAPRSLHYLCGPLPDRWSAAPSTDPSVPATALAAATTLTRDWLDAYAGALWPASVPAGAGAGGFDWQLLRDPAGSTGAARLGAQFIRANIDPTERYVLSVAGSTATRLPADGSGLANLVLAGDWTHSDWNAGCIEAAVTTGINAARAVRARADAG